MEKQILNLTIDIKAPKEKVWEVLLQDDTYRQWTAVFHPGSYAESDWKEGSEALFKTPEGDGLISKVILHQPAEVISFEHLGTLKNGVRSSEAFEWKGFRETYRVSAKGGGTELRIEQDITPEHTGWFTDTWNKALQKVKELAEGGTDGK